jgi:hypothetical protein
MKVCFILGPYRPGKCGISDYVNLLGKELASRGHSILWKSIDSSVFFDNLSKDLPDADFYSIQFAPYAFAKRGLSGKSLFRFARAIRKKKTQVNFHEIWIGAYPEASWKEKIIGGWQKREILKFLKIAQPRVIHASNPAAIDRFKTEGIEAKFLYLFGNIPFHSADNQPDEMPKLRVAFFGTLYEQFPYELLGKRLKEISLAFAKEVDLRIIGRQREGNGLSKLSKMAETNNFKATITGELRADEISLEFQMCSLGISTTPYDILGKSGATAAMLEHGLPILAYDDGDTSVENLFVPEPFREQVFLLNEENISGHLIKFMQIPARSFFDGVSHVAENMLGAIR